MKPMNHGYENELARAISALPYRSPSRGFKGRVLAALAAEEAASSSLVWKLLAGAGALCAAWAVLLAMAGITAALENSGAIVSAIESPARSWAQFKLLGYGAWKAAARLAQLSSLVFSALDIGGFLKSHLPEIGAGAVIASLLASGLGNGQAVHSVK